MTIFPDRRIGRLEPGYQASFLVLSANPLKELGNLGTIEMRFNFLLDIHTIFASFTPIISGRLSSPRPRTDRPFI